MQTKQKRKKCRECGRKTLHVAHVRHTNMGAGFIAGNLILCLITLGIWLPIFALLLGLGILNNSLAPLAAKYHCQICGRRN